MRSLASALAFALALILGSPHWTAADPIIDVVTFTPTVFSGFSLIREQRVGQSFTAALTGRLSRIDLAIISRREEGGPASIRFELFHSADPFAAGNPLFTSLLIDPIPRIGNIWFPIDVGAVPITVTAGQQFSVLLTTLVNGGTWATSHDNPYTEGNTYIQSRDELTGPLNSDVALRSFVDSGGAPVPEPGTLVLLSTALAGIGIRRWRFKNQVNR